MLDAHMAKFQQEMGIERSLQSEIPGTYLLPLDEGLTIQLSSLEEGVSLSCQLLKCPKENQEELYTHLLLANLFGQGTAGAVLALSENGDFLTLSHPIDHALPYKEFKDVLEEFINSVDFWRQEALNPLKK